MGSIALFAIEAISLKICFHIALCLFTLGEGGAEGFALELKET